MADAPSGALDAHRAGASLLRMSESTLPAQAGSARFGRGTLLAVIAVGGAAVLGSYLMAFSRENASAVLWGGVPGFLKPLYTVNMWLAALGFFPMTWVLALREAPGRVRFLGGRGFGTLFPLYLLVLVPSALWMPLTFAWAEAPSTLGWWIVRVDLLLVGIGALGLLGATLTVQPRPRPALHVLAVVGALAFCLQTAVLDALVWPAYYPVP